MVVETNSTETLCRNQSFNGAIKAARQWIGKGGKIEIVDQTDRKVVKSFTIRGKRG